MTADRLVDLAPKFHANALVYLASPYSHEHAWMRELRYREACRITAALMNLGLVVFSPIAHGHGIAKLFQLPTAWQYWQQSCEAMVGRSQYVFVADMGGWRESVGVQKEIEFAKKRAIPVSLLTTGFDLVTL
jgi:hypothetical protein